MGDLLILLPAFCLAALMIFTHTYLGLHVLARGVIFVDLALAQMAALGASVAFAGLRRIPDKTAREVIIGCTYVVSTALSIVILSRSAQGMEELKALFNGNILWVSWGEIAVVAAAYGLLALVHAIFRRRFYALSFEDEGAAQPGFLWEFLFFASFAVVITFAVNVAGVLLVFAFLIIPAFSASLLVEGFLPRLLLGWGLALIGCALGLWTSFVADLPVGATVVSVLGILPLAAGMAHLLRRRVLRTP